MPGLALPQMVPIERPVFSALLRFSRRPGLLRTQA